MQFQYGAYFHDVNSVFFKSIQREFVRSPTGRKHLVRTNWQMEGKLIRNSMFDIMVALDQLQAAYSVDNQLAVMLDNNGQPTVFLVDTNQVVGGVIVTNPISHENLSGAHGVTYLKYSFGLSFDVLWSANTDVLSWEETLSFSDNQGLPIQVERVPVNGSPIIQNVSQSSFFYATQSGQMTQSGPNPRPPIATFPGMFRGQPGSNQVTLLPVEAVRGTAIKYGVTWKYEFISTTPFFNGTPNFR